MIRLSIKSLSAVLYSLIFYLGKHVILTSCVDSVQSFTVLVFIGDSGTKDNRSME